MKRMKYTIDQIQVGSRVTFKAVGKAARAEGMAGKLVTATVTEIGLTEIIVLSDHRKDPASDFYQMESVVSPRQLLSVSREVN